MRKVPVQQIADIYAQAIYKAAERAGALPRVQTELRLLDEVLAQDAKLRLFFESPTISFETKKAVAGKALAECSPLTHNFFMLILRRERVTEYEKIVAELEHHASRLAGIAEVEVETAEPLADDQRGRLKAMLEAKLRRVVRLDEHLHPQLLGGVILRHEGKQWNASLSHRLKRVIESLAELKGSHGAWSE